MSSNPTPYTQLSKGTLLIATPEIESGIFYRSVVLLCEHNLSGSFGLILNKEIDFEIGENIIELEELSNPKVELLAGGPVQMNQMLVLSNMESDDSIPILKKVALGGDLEFLQESLLDPDGPSIRLIFGYSTWSAGQLEREFLNGQWFLYPGSARQVFDIPVDEMWRTILKEMGGRYASLSMIPEDLSLN